ncbi:MAG: hypothetical protein QGG31_05425, partial [Anaerolineales bacterium]|nr:hypothetical protein [Anaerolineales bacterium]
MPTDKFTAHCSSHHIRAAVFRMIAAGLAVIVGRTARRPPAALKNTPLLNPRAGSAPALRSSHPA